MSLPKPESKEKARQLRLDGTAIPEIARQLQVSKSSVSLWVRGLPTPVQFTPEFRAAKRGERLDRLKEIQAIKKQQRLEERQSRIRVHVEKVSKQVIREPIGKRIISGDGRWMIPAPPGYKGKTYIKGFYVYEHRYMMEQKVERLLTYNEVVHHKNGDKLDNRFCNLELTTRAGHSSQHSPTAVMVTLICAQCGRYFERWKRQYKEKISKGQTRFFCCRSHQVSFQQTKRWSDKRNIPG